MWLFGLSHIDVMKIVKTAAWYIAINILAVSGVTYLDSLTKGSKFNYCRTNAVGEKNRCFCRGLS
jgi:hypothetical protein